MTRQPEEAKRFTVAWPMPREAPVSTRVLRFCWPLVGMMSIVRSGPHLGLPGRRGRVKARRRTLKALRDKGGS